MKPYALATGEGRSYTWHGVVFTMKAAAPETGGALAIWELTTRPGEEPQEHVHDAEDEIFFIIDGAMTVHCAGRDFPAIAGTFMFIPRGTPHTYTITSESVKVLGMSTPSSFGDHIERTGLPVKTTTE